MIEWGTVIVTGFAGSLGSTVGAYIMTNHVIRRLEHKEGESKSNFSKDVKRFIEYMTGGLGQGGDMF